MPSCSGCIERSACGRLICWRIVYWISQGAWPKVLRCISKFDLLVQQHSGAPGDNILFALPGQNPPNQVAEKSKGRKLFGFRCAFHSSRGSGDALKFLNPPSFNPFPC
jgi:hypothetical protein